eukprot:161384-Pyramimonas_sp.AAC.1
MRGALRHNAQGGRVSGRALECLLGHCVVEALNLWLRLAPSVLRASYVFTRGCCEAPRPPWDS